MTLGSFDDQVEAAMRVSLSGWDFSWIAHRVRDDPLPWDYAAEAEVLLANAHAALDIDTGDGDALASFDVLPPVVVATEGFAPHVPLARCRLAGRRAEVREQPDSVIPANSSEFDLVINRHGRLDASEVARVLRPGGRLITQQVGSSNESELSDAFGVGAPPTRWNLDVATTQLQQAGLTIDTTADSKPAVHYADIGAVVYQLRLVSWQIPGFSPDRYRDQLRKIFAVIDADGRFTSHAHRFKINAHLPG